MRTRTSLAPALWSAATAAVLWTLSALSTLMLASGSHPTLAFLVNLQLPGVLDFAQRTPSFAVITAISAVMVAAIVFIAARLWRRGAGITTFFTVWFGSVFATWLGGVMISIGILAVETRRWGPGYGLSFLSDADRIGWGVLFGWIPALVAALLLRQTHRAGASELGTSRWPSIVAAAVAVVLSVALAITGDVGSPPPVQPTKPSPSAPTPARTPLPSAVPQYGDRHPAPAGSTDCMPGQLSMSFGGTDAGLGHRSLSVIVRNVGFTSCTLEGYPSIAFARADGKPLTITVLAGTSHLAEDAGPTPIALARGESARAEAAWDAMTSADVTGQAERLVAAPLAGEAASSFPYSFDIVEGGQITVTAWQRATGDQYAD
jgi:hypothetical protein